MSRIGQVSSTTSSAYSPSCTGQNAPPVPPGTPVPTPWNWWDFVLHYYFGEGVAIDLGDAGLLDAVIAASEFHTDAWKSGVKLSAWAASKDLCKGTTTGSDDTDIEQSPDEDEFSDGGVGVPVDLSDVSFVLGSSRIRRGYSCHIIKDCCTRCFTYSCTLTYQIRDEFSDPLESGFEPGGTPYAINGDWGDYTCDEACPDESLPLP